MKNVRDLIKLLPDDSLRNEALLSIECIVTTPKLAKIRCNLTHEFRLNVKLSNNQFVIFSENRKEIICNQNDFIKKLSSEIYEIDEAISEKSYVQSKPDSCFILPDSIPPAPDYMDLPTWDDENKRWYDAEY